MKRVALTSAAALLCSILAAPSAFAQTQKAAAKDQKAGAQASATKATASASTQQAPAAPAKWVKPIKGTATVDVIQGTPKRVGNEMVTVLRIRNSSPGAINLLRVDEYWYNKQPAEVSGDTQSYRKPFNPGEIIEITMKSPIKPDLYRSTYNFSHANGAVKATAVKKFQ
jgi:hypothetical protein